MIQWKPLRTQIMTKKSLETFENLRGGGSSELKTNKVIWMLFYRVVEFISDDDSTPISKLCDLEGKAQNCLKCKREITV